MENHVNWPKAMGARVLINDGWYQTRLGHIRNDISNQSLD